MIGWFGCVKRSNERRSEEAVSYQPEDTEDYITSESSYTCLQEKSAFQRLIGTALTSRVNKEP
jgi:hypothetical protein